MKFSQYKESQKRSYSENVKMNCLKLISKPFINPNFHIAYLINLSETISEMCTTCTPIYLLYSAKFQGLKHPRKPFIEKVPR